MGWVLARMESGFLVLNTVNAGNLVTPPFNTQEKSPNNSCACVCACVCVHFCHYSSLFIVVD